MDSEPKTFADQTIVPRAVASDPKTLDAWLGTLCERLTENGVIVYDGRGNVVSANSVAARILGRGIPVGSSFMDMASTFRMEDENATPLPGTEHPVALALRGVETHDRTIQAHRVTGG